MRKARIYLNGKLAAELKELEKNSKYQIAYSDEYRGTPISLTLPITEKKYNFDYFPNCFEGLLPEGIQLQGLLKRRMLDKNDLFSQLVAVGQDMVGSITVEEVK